MRTRLHKLKATVLVIRLRIRYQSLHSSWFQEINDLWFSLHRVEFTPLRVNRAAATRTRAQDINTVKDIMSQHTHRMLLTEEALSSSQSEIYGLASALTSIPVTKEVSIDVMDVGVNGGTAGDAARGHVGIILWVNVLKALPWHTGAEF